MHVWRYYDSPRGKWLPQRIAPWLLGKALGSVERPGPSDVQSLAEGVLAAAYDAALGGEAEKLRQLLHDVAMESGHGQEKLSDKTYGRVLDALHDFPPLAEPLQDGGPPQETQTLDEIAADMRAEQGERLVLWICSRCDRVKRLHDGDERPECCGPHVSLGERAEQEHEPTPMLAVPYRREPS